MGLENLHLDIREWTVRLTFIITFIHYFKFRLAVQLDNCIPAADKANCDDLLITDIAYSQSTSVNTISFRKWSLLQ